MSSMDLPFFKCYASNELAVTMELSNEELGLYFRLMNKYWCERERGLDKSTMERFYKQSPIEHVEYILDKFFILKDSTYHHKGLLEQIETYNINSQRQKKRIEVTSEQPQGNLKVTSKVALSSSSSSSSSNNIKHDLTFDLFWKDVKNKLGVGQVKKAFSKLPDDWKNKPEVLSNLYNQHFISQGKFAKYPATWLNAECYLDSTVIDDEPTEEEQKQYDRRDWEFAKNQGRWPTAYSSQRIKNYEDQFGKINE